MFDIRTAADMRHTHVTREMLAAALSISFASAYVTVSRSGSKVQTYSPEIYTQS